MQTYRTLIVNSRKSQLKYPAYTTKKENIDYLIHKGLTEVKMMKENNEGTRHIEKENQLMIPAFD